MKNDQMLSLNDLATLVNSVDRARTDVSPLAASLRDFSLNQINGFKSASVALEKLEGALTRKQIDAATAKLAGLQDASDFAQTFILVLAATGYPVGGYYVRDRAAAIGAIDRLVELLRSIEREHARSVLAGEQKAQ